MKNGCEKSYQNSKVRQFEGQFSYKGSSHDTNSQTTHFLGTESTRTKEDEDDFDLSFDKEFFFDFQMEDLEIEEWRKTLTGPLHKLFYNYNRASKQPSN